MIAEVACVLALVDGSEWQLGDPVPSGARWLASTEAGLWVTYDARSAMVKVEWPDPVAIEVAGIRARIAELRLNAAEATARPGPFARPATVELRDARGRAYARVTIESR